MKNMWMVMLLVCLLCSTGASVAAQTAKKWTYMTYWEDKTILIVITEKQGAYEVSGEMIQKVGLGKLTDTFCHIEGRYVPEKETLTAMCQGRGTSIRLRGRKVPGVSDLSVKVESGTEVTDVLMFPIKNRPEKPPDILGTWNSNTTSKYRYTFAPDGYDVVWRLSAIDEDGKITIKGDTLYASWKNNKTSGSATGRATQVDANNRATRIEWSNGVVFTR